MYSAQTIYSEYITLLDHQSIHTRCPVLDDGHRVNALVARCTPLDMNSTYCNLLQTSHFSSTSILAEKDGEVLGFISGYRLPESPNVLFVWQVAVDAKARGIGLGRRLLVQLLHRLASSGVTTLHTSITPTNQASWGLFRDLSERLQCPMNESPWMDKQQHFDGKSDSETLVIIGPFTSKNIQQVHVVYENL